MRPFGVFRLVKWHYVSFHGQNNFASKWMRTEELSTVGNQLKSICISILSGGGNVSTEYYPGRFRPIWSKNKVSGVTMFQTSGRPFVKREKNLSLHADTRGQPKRLAEPELDLVQLLIKCRPSRTYKGINWRKYRGTVHGNSSDFCNRSCCPRPLTRRENDLEKDDEARRRKIHPW